MTASSTCPRALRSRACEGLTHVIDKGISLAEIEGLFDTAGDYVDVVKLGWGTSYVTRNLEKKIALYRSFETPVVCGGTLFEAAVAREQARRVQELARGQPASPTSRSPTGRSTSRASASSS